MLNVNSLTLPLSYNTSNHILKNIFLSTWFEFKIKTQNEDIDLNKEMSKVGLGLGLGRYHLEIPCFPCRFSGIALKMSNFALEFSKARADPNHFCSLFQNYQSESEQKVSRTCKSQS